MYKAITMPKFFLIDSGAFFVKHKTRWNDKGSIEENTEEDIKAGKR